MSLRMTAANAMQRRQQRRQCFRCFVAVAAQNFLGQKRVQLDPGDAATPAPSGYEVPAENVTTPTDLDQVLNVLDADTRTRAMVLLNEAGAAVLGRRVDS